MPLKPGAALLFDIDGTMVDSDPLHLVAFNMVFGPYGHTFDRARFGSDLQGFTNEAIAARFFPEEAPARRMAIMDEKEATFRRLAEEGIEPVHGLHALLDWAEAEGIPAIAVTNAPRANADQVLAATRLRPRLRGLVVAGDLAHGKPHPLPYLEGLRLLEADPAHSVAFEDSRAGIVSATTAGIATIGMATGLSPQQLIEAGAIMGVPDYRDSAVLDFIKSRLLA